MTFLLHCDIFEIKIAKFLEPKKVSVTKKCNFVTFLKIPIRIESPTFVRDFVTKMQKFTLLTMREKNTNYKKF